MTTRTVIPTEIAIATSLANLVIPTWPEVRRSLEIAVAPQLSLTLTNAVIVTAGLREFFPVTGSIASERNLALSSGLANVLLCPLGRCRCATGRAVYRPNIASVREPV